MKTPLQKAKDKLWALCRAITAKLYPDSICYTCGRGPLVGSNRHLGHFIHSSICSAFMRYKLDNLRWQCYDCNINKNGMTLAYRKALIAECGAKRPDELERQNQETTGNKYGLDWYLEQIDEYEDLLKKAKPVRQVPWQ